MVVKYDIMGRKVGSHYLAIGVLSTLFGGIYYATSGSSAKATDSGAKITAGSKAEENFIQDFLKEADKNSAKH
ncbi:hypothetical protein MBLNU457_3516t1 [Dothideomycetes sp. NU457]